MNAKYLKNLFFLVLMATVIACATKKDESQEAEATEQKDWKEMDDYHMIMAEAFHPYKDSANLEPAKRMAGELSTSANTWASAALPKKVDNDETKSKLEELKNESSAFVQTVAAGDDKAIADHLTKLHDIFHVLQETWYGGHGAEGHQH
jgi:hypothetical protein